MLLDHWRKYVHYLAQTKQRAFKLQPSDKEDLVSHMFLCLLTLPPDKRAFISYSKSVIINALNGALVQLAGKHYDVAPTLRFEEVVRTEDENDNHMEVALGLNGYGTDGEACWEHMVLMDKVHSLIADLKPSEQDVVRRYFFAEEDLRTIAASLGVSHQRVAQILKKALTVLRRRLRATP